MSWNIVNESYPQVLRGILHQTEEGLPYLAPQRRIHSMGERPGGGNVAAVSELIREVGLRLRRFKLNNRTAGNAIVGIGFRWANRYWSAGQLVAADTPDFTDDTTDAQDGPVATPDFALMNTTASDGWAVHSDRKFSWVSVRIETVDVGASADVTADYSDFAGTGWTAVAAGSQMEAAGSSLIKAAGSNYGDAEERCMIWAPPNNWGQTAVGGLDGIPVGRYALRFLCNVATTAAVASVIEVGSLVAMETVATNAEYASGDSMTYFDPYGEALVAFFSVADAGNRVYAEVTTF